MEGEAARFAAVRRTDADLVALHRLLDVWGELTAEIDALSLCWPICPAYRAPCHNS